MEGKRFRCRHCKKLCLIRVQGQQYCGNSACQQSRKNEWRRKKYAADEDYRLNQKESTDAWLEQQGGCAAYYRRYRQNLNEQNENESAAAQAEASASIHGDCETCIGVPANRDATIGKSLIKTGRYIISPEFAKRDAFLAEILLISSG